MKRKIRIAAATILALAGLLPASVPPPAFAVSPLLSGYGGPGAGEQAILGSTLVGGRGGKGRGSRGGGPRAGSAGNSTRGSAETGGTVSPAGSSGGSPSPNGNGATGVGTGARGRARGGSLEVGKKSKAAGSSRAKSPAAYVYPASLAAASGGTSALSISSTDLLLLLGIVATLGLIGVFTVRLARLQP